MLVNGTDPGFDILKRLFIGAVESNDNAISLLVECMSDGVESLLASSVPNLHLDVLSFR
jgi:hypothetical protein